MASAKFIILFLLASCFLITFCSAQPPPQNCSDYTFSSPSHHHINKYTACNDLPTLNSSLHWNYYPSNHTIDIAYRHRGMTDSNWIVWSLNPTSTAMIGSQCLVAFKNSTNNLIRAYTSPISSYATTLQEGPLSFEVPTIAAQLTSTEMIIYGTIRLPANRTSFSHVWQSGDVVGNVLLPHQMKGDNMKSYGTIDFATGKTVDAGAKGGSGAIISRKKVIHGVLNTVSWGLMLPFGAGVARYLKMFNSPSPLWFYLHVTCQSSGYIVGVAGWVTGLILGRDSPGIVHQTHRCVGIAIFALGTLQVLAMGLRPKPDHKYRIYWNIYHQLVGYTVIALSIANIFKGFEILDAGDKWKNGYIGILILFGACVAVLEPYSWYLVWKRKREAADKDSQSLPGNTNIEQGIV